MYICKKNYIEGRSDQQHQTVSYLQNCSYAQHFVVVQYEEFAARQCDWLGGGCHHNRYVSAKFGAAQMPWRAENSITQSNALHYEIIYIQYHVQWNIWLEIRDVPVASKYRRCNTAGQYPGWSSSYIRHTLNSARKIHLCSIDEIINNNNRKANAIQRCTYR